MAHRLSNYSYFGTTDSTISDAEKAVGITSLFPVVYDKDLPPLYREDGKHIYANFEEPLKLPITGQGVIAVKLTPGHTFTIIVSPSPSPTPQDDEKALKLELTDKSADFFTLTSKGGPVKIDSDTPKGPQAAWLEPGKSNLYWLSIDKKNGTLRYGKAFRSAAMTFLHAKINIGDETKNPGPFLWVKKLKYVFIASPAVITVQQDVRPDLQQLSISKLPIVTDLPPVVAESTKVTLEDLAIGTVTSIANLEAECQRLYTNVDGANVKLDEADFPDFSQAIEYSIRTPGKSCYEKLKSKTEFGDKDMTYLRITLGSDQGRSPGVPFVVEIWPSQHKSPIHDHGEAYAVIKVLHGEIHALFFDQLDDKKDSRIKLEPDYCFHQGEVTWLGPDQYQVHQLHNKSDRVCVTIQCYQYGSTDPTHDEYFAYINGKTQKKELFYPDSDWDFITFKSLIKQEWESHLKDLEWK